MDSVSSRIVGAQCEGLLLQEMFKPLAAGFGDCGEIFIGALSQTIARNDRNGFGATLARVLAADVRTTQ